MAIPRIPWGWRERLDQLRREQNPGLYQEDRPALQIPLPIPQPRERVKDVEDHDPDHEPGCGVIILDI